MDQINKNFGSVHVTNSEVAQGESKLIFPSFLRIEDLGKRSKKGCRLTLNERLYVI